MVITKMTGSVKGKGEVFIYFYDTILNWGIHFSQGSVDAGEVMSLLHLLKWNI